MLSGWRAARINSIIAEEEDIAAREGSDYTRFTEEGSILTSTANDSSSNIYKTTTTTPSVNYNFANNMNNNNNNNKFTTTAATTTTITNTVNKNNNTASAAAAAAAAASAAAAAEAAAAVVAASAAAAISASVATTLATPFATPRAEVTPAPAPAPAPAPSHAAGSDAALLPSSDAALTDPALADDNNDCKLPLDAVGSSEAESMDEAKSLPSLGSMGSGCEDDITEQEIAEAQAATQRGEGSEAALQDIPDMPATKASSRVSKE